MSTGPVHASVFITGTHPEEASHIDEDYDDPLSRVHKSIPLCTFIPRKLLVSSISILKVPMVISLSKERQHSSIHIKRECHRETDLLAVALPNCSKSAGVASLPSVLPPSASTTDASGERESGVGARVDISRVFAERMGLHSGELVLVRAIDKEALSLTRVVLLAATARDFSVATSQEREFRELMLANRQIISRGKQVMLSFKESNLGNDNEESTQDDTIFTFTVLDCQPLAQGLVCEKLTKIVVVPPLELGNRSNDGPDSKILKDMEDTRTFIDIGYRSEAIPRSSSPEPLFMSSFILPEYKHFFQQHAREPFHTTKRHNKLSVGLMPEPIDNPQPMAEWRDSLCEVGTTLATLRHMHIFSGSWVVITCRESGKERLARVYAMGVSNGAKLEEGKIYLPPSMLFNLQINAVHLEGKTVFVRPVEGNTSVGGKQSLPCSLARAVKIGRIKGPHSSGSRDYTQPLLRHFSFPRVMSPGDVFPVVIPPASSLLSYVGSEEDSEDDNDNEEEEFTEGSRREDYAEGRVVYFKVMEITPDTNAQDLPDEKQPREERSQFFLVSREETSLIHEGSLNSPFPPLIRSYLFPQSLDDDGSVLTREGTEEVELVVEAAVHGPAARLGIGCALLLYGPPANGKTRLALQIAQRMGLHTHIVDCFDLVRAGEVETEGQLRSAFKVATQWRPCLLLLRSLQAFQSAMANSYEQPKGEGPAGLSKLLHQLIAQHCDRNANEQDDVNYPVVIIATTDSLDQLPASLRSCFRHELNMPTPGMNDRHSLLKNLLRDTTLAMEVSIEEIARKTASFVERDLRTMLTLAATSAITNLIQPLSTTNRSEAKDYAKRETKFEEAVRSAGVLLTWDDIDNAINQIQSQQSVNIGAPKIPNVTWDDVGGLAKVKEEILDTIQLPLKRPDLFSSDLRKRSGILLYGPPGTGKTLVAKAVATECSLNFLSVKGPELINMYIGESEKNVRDTFQKARDARPCVIFFDEVDSLAPARGAGADSGGVMDRIVSQLLTELDAIHHSSDIFVIGATNRPDLLDPALLRPGRFDRLLYLGVCEDHKSQLNIIQALTRKFNLGESVDLEALVQQCPLTFTGADFYAICSDAMLNAIRDRVTKREEASATFPSQRESQPEEDSPVTVEQNHLLEALRTITPSVSEADLQKYRELQHNYDQSRSRSSTS